MVCGDTRLDGREHVGLPVDRMYEWTACGSPRLASALYRDYICKTIRLNHFLNKRILSPFAGGRDRRRDRYEAGLQQPFPNQRGESTGLVRTTEIFRSTYGTRVPDPPVLVLEDT